MQNHGVRACLTQGADNMLEKCAHPLRQDIRMSAA
jgi:hypothetical protein